MVLNDVHLVSQSHQDHAERKKAVLQSKRGSVISKEEESGVRRADPTEITAFHLLVIQDIENTAFLHTEF